MAVRTQDAAGLRDAPASGASQTHEWEAPTIEKLPAVNAQDGGAIDFDAFAYS